MTQPDCKFTETCGGGHTTAQHYLSVYERVINEHCGWGAYYSIKAAVDRDAKEKK